MTVALSGVPKSYEGTGADTALSTVFLIFAAVDVVVTKRITATGVDTVLAEGVHYNTTGYSADGAAGTVTPINGSTNFPDTVTWTLSRSVALTQSLDYVENDNFPAVSHERGLDRLQLQVQDADQKAGRAISIPVADDSDTNAPLTVIVPDATTRASKVLGFDADGNTVVTTDAGLSLTTQGDILTLDSSGDYERIPAPTRAGYALMGSLIRGAETAESSALEPVWRTPYVHPHSLTQGFEMTTSTASPLTEAVIGRGVAVPLYATGGSFPRSVYELTENREINFRADASSRSRYYKQIDSTWAADSFEGGLASGATLPTTIPDFLHVFAMGRSNDAAYDIGFDTNRDGTGLVADSAVKLWHDDSGGQKLFLRRVRSILIYDSEIVPFRTAGDWTYLDAPFSSGFTGREISGVDLNAIPTSVAIPTISDENAIVTLSISWKHNVTAGAILRFHPSSTGTDHYDVSVSHSTSFRTFFTHTCRLGAAPNMNLKTSVVGGSDVTTSLVAFRDDREVYPRH